MASNRIMRQRASLMRTYKTSKELVASDLLKQMRVPVTTQVVIGKRYILDFVGKDRLFVLEIDGVSHDYQREYDAVRDSLLDAAGFKIFRVKNEDVSLEAFTGIKDLFIVPRQEVRDRVAYAQLLSNHSAEQWKSLKLVNK